MSALGASRRFGGMKRITSLFLACAVCVSCAATNKNPTTDGNSAENNSAAMNSAAKETAANGEQAPDKEIYAEVVRDGRIHVIGWDKTATDFRSGGHLPYTRTLIGAGPKGETIVIESEKKGHKLANRLEKEFHKRHPVETYTELNRDGRIYVIGWQGTASDFKKGGHVPYTRTLIGAGPKGETIVFESEKKGHKLANRLEKEFHKRHPVATYTELSRDGRIYVIGWQGTASDFKKGGHVPYTRTLIGAGPNGETIVFESEKKGHKLANRLEKEFHKRHPVATYTELRRDGRIYVIGWQGTASDFKKGGHVPYTRTLIGAGPNGETIVIESEKKGHKLANRLEKEFHKRHPVPTYTELRRDGRIYVIGWQGTASDFKKGGHVPYTRTLIGAGPKGESIVFESEKKGHELADRLQAEYNRRHGK